MGARQQSELSADLHDSRGAEQSPDSVYCCQVTAWENPLILHRSALNATSSRLPSLRLVTCAPVRWWHGFEGVARRHATAPRRGPGDTGPSYSLTHAVAGKTITRVIPVGPSVDVTQQQLEEYHRFRELVQELVTISEQICDLQLRQPRDAAEGAIKKNRARRPSGG
jgi:hypothetical protein